MGVHLTSFIGYRICVKDSESESRSVASDSWWPHGLCSPWNSPGQNAGVGSLSLLQGISPTQGANPGLPHCRWILYQLSHQGSPVGSCKKWRKAFQWYKGPAILWLQQRSATARPPLFLLWLADVSWSSLHLTLMTIPELRHLLSIFCTLNSRILWSPGQLQKMETLIFLAEWKQLVPSSCSEHWGPGCLWEEVCSQVSRAWDSGEKGHVSVLVEWS